MMNANSRYGTLRYLVIVYTSCLLCRFLFEQQMKLVLKVCKDENNVMALGMNFLNIIFEIKIDFL